MRPPKRILLSHFRIFPKSLGLQFRVTTIAASIIALSVVTTAFLLVRVTKEQFQNSLADQAHEIARRLEVRLAPLMAAQNPNAIDAVLKQEFSQDPHIAFIQVRDVAGKVRGKLTLDPQCWDNYQKALADNIFTPDSKPIAEFGPTSLKDPEHPEALVYEHGLSIVITPEQATPFNSFIGTRTPAHQIVEIAGTNGAAGTVLLGLVDPGYRRAIASLQGTAITIAFLVFFISIPISAILVRRVTRPLRRIANAAEEFSIAYNVRQIRVNRSDEIGQLAGSFNRMATRLAEAHDALLQINEGLEETVTERTAQVRLANVALQTEIDSKNEFIRTITHDLNAPLRNIAGMAQMIRKRHGTDLPDEVLQRIQRIEANVEIETSMLDDLLELSRLRTRTYHSEDLDLNAILEDIRLALEPEMLEREIQCLIQPNLPTLHLEPKLFRQVFQNLIDNAIKYMGNRPLKQISIQATLEKNYILLTVTDTGPGITPEAQQRVFDLFSRGSTALLDEKMDQPGRGVGLANVKTVVERWEGTIQLHSKVGQGTTFEIRIPINRLVKSSQLKLSA